MDYGGLFDPYSNQPYPYSTYNSCQYPSPCQCPHSDERRLHAIMQRQAQREYQQRQEQDSWLRKSMAEAAAEKELEQEKIMKEAKKKVEDINRGKAERAKDEERGKKAREEEAKRKEKEAEKETRRKKHRHCHASYIEAPSYTLVRGRSHHRNESYLGVVKSYGRRHGSCSSSSDSCC